MYDVGTVHKLRSSELVSFMKNGNCDDLLHCSLLHVFSLGHVHAPSPASELSNNFRIRIVMLRMHHWRVNHPRSATCPTPSSYGQGCHRAIVSLAPLSALIPQGGDRWFLRRAHGPEMGLDIRHAGDGRSRLSSEPVNDNMFTTSKVPCGTVRTDW